MCTTWTDQQWLDNSKPATQNSEYTLIGSWYNNQGAVARTYSEGDGYVWAVLPGFGNYVLFSTDEAAQYGVTPTDAALGYIKRAGYTMTENPLAPVSPAELGLGDLVENFA